MAECLPLPNVAAIVQRCPPCLCCLRCCSLARALGLPAPRSAVLPACSGILPTSWREVKENKQFMHDIIKATWEAVVHPGPNPEAPLKAGNAIYLGEAGNTPVCVWGGGAGNFKAKASVGCKTP